MATLPNTALVLSNVPNRAFCGIDLLSFTTSPKFQGIRHLPPGWHFIFTGVDDSFSVRHGAWFHVDWPSQNDHIVLVKDWDASLEELVPVTDPAVLASWRQKAPQIWRESLTPYRQSVPTTNTGDNGIASEEVVKHEEDGTGLTQESNDWPLLTDSITPALLSRLTKQPINTLANHYALTSASSAKQDFDSIPGLSTADNAVTSEGELGVLPIDLKQTWREGAIGRERTQAAQDRSWAFRELVRLHCNDDEEEVLGELQVTFLMVLTLNNNSCLEQWKRLLGLFLTCVEVALEKAELWIRMLQLLGMQLRRSLDADGGLFDLSESGGALLKALLGRFRRGLEGKEGMAKEDLMDELDELENYMKVKHGWGTSGDYLKRGMLQLEDGEMVEMDMEDADLDDESGDYAPVIVDLTPEQIQQLHGHGNATLSLNPKHPPHERLGVQDAQEDSSDDGQDLEDMDMRY